ncbi:hypothetical protein [Aestuariivirga litoralis]|uniref:hypothetical protein n=1 Tax=Aestuariivirga litoralis TaxID=2650924 RepID=UPI0018C7021D|nr:hypothetical protein [Aestuariivirga litoralis]MBG1232962.1 hypothetical protein [Aestuariivirga litoralis]
MSLKCPLGRYYICHIAVALIIAVCLWPLFGLDAGLCAGAAFYCGREFTQWQSGLPFDWKGLLAPLLICLAIEAARLAFIHHFWSA